jgi:hypothetical protein
VVGSEPCYHGIIVGVHISVPGTKLVSQTYLTLHTLTHFSSVAFPLNKGYRLEALGVKKYFTSSMTAKHL